MIGVPTPSKGQSRISVATATYNRAHLLSRAFDSLRDGTCYPLEWIVIDDGSTDGTEDVISQLSVASPFPIVYHRKENGGAHTAMNIAFGLLRGELFVKLDSDDWLCPAALEDIQRDWDNIPETERKDFAGLSYLCAYEDGRVIGKSFTDNVTDGTYTKIRLNRRIHGDKCEAVRSDLVYKNLCREFPGESSIPYEFPLFMRFSRYSLAFRHINHVVKIMEYQADGITNSTPWEKRRQRSPQGFAEMDKESLLSRDLNFKTKARSWIYSIVSPSRKYIGWDIYVTSFVGIIFDIVVFVKNSLLGKIDKNYEVR